MPRSSRASPTPSSVTFFKVHSFRFYTPSVPSFSLPPLLARAAAAIERGHGAEAVQTLSPALKTSNLGREDELAVRSLLAEAWLLQDDLEQAASATRPSARHLP